MKNVKINTSVLRKLNNQSASLLPSENQNTLSVNVEFSNHSEIVFCQMSIIELIKEVCISPENIKEKSIDIFNALKIVNALAPVTQMEFLDKLLIDNAANYQSTFVDVNSLK